MRFVVSPRAQADIDDIWEYTVEQWGVRRAEVYLRLIKEAVEVVAADPVTATAVVVVRILHQRMDVERHL